MFDSDPFGSVDKAVSVPKNEQPKEESPEEVEAELTPAERRKQEAAERKAETERKREEAAREKAQKAKVALGGRFVDTEELLKEKPLPSWPQPTADDEYIPEEVDYYDLRTLNRQINASRTLSFRTKNRLADARIHEAETGERYRRAYNKQMVALSGGTAEQRKAIAEVSTEDLYSEFIVAQTVVKNLTSLSYAVSKDLDTLKSLSDNMRKQMSLGGEH